MKLEVGMYVRTKDGVIGKITNEDYTYSKSWIIDTLYYNFDEDVDKWTCGVKEYEISKASHALLGNDKEPCLIEVGDYVNGVEIVEIDNDPFIKGQINLWTNIRNTNGFGDIEIIKIIDKDIKTIVTKEQFEQMEYKVGE